jgi:hypothetical protein
VTPAAAGAASWFPTWSARSFTLVPFARSSGILDRRVMTRDYETQITSHRRRSVVVIAENATC